MIRSFRASISTYLLLLSTLYCNVAFAADYPTIMITIKPFYNLCARVMQSVGTPELLLHNNASPHDYQLKPSDIKLLEGADLVIWGGPELETYLNKPMSNIAAAKSLNLATIPDLKLLPLRTSTNWEADAHDHHDHSHDGQQINDPHFWLSPANAIIITQAIAQRLSQIDPTHAKTYRKNAADFVTEITLQQNKWRQQLAVMHGIPFIVFHDAYQYFDSYFDLDGIGSITLNPEIPPSVQRIQQIQLLLQQNKVRCIYSEPQFNAKIIATLTDGMQIYQGTLDPLGREADIGPNGYVVLIDDLVQSFSSCAAHHSN